MYKHWQHRIRLTHKTSHIISKTFNDYDNDYYTCNKISKHFHNQTNRHTHTHTRTRALNLNCHFYVTVVNWNYSVIKRTHRSSQWMERKKLSKGMGEQKFTSYNTLLSIRIYERTLALPFTSTTHTHTRAHISCIRYNPLTTINKTK